MPKQQEQQRKPLKLLCLTSITMAKLCWLLAIHAIIILTSSETRFCDGSSKKSCKCVHNDACTLYCIGNDICKGSDMTLGCKAGQPCNVICNSDAEENACEDALIDGSLATSLTVTCQDAKSCHGTRVLCGSGDCSVACTSFSGAYSQCENTALSCGSGKCSMQCELGSNTCLGVSINILPTTKSFECTQPGWQNVGCSYIDNYVLPPFSLTTQSPTPATRTPTKSPTHQPSLAPTLRPSLPTASPTLRPSRNPSLYPSGTPSLSPNTAPTPYHYTRTPTDYPTTPAPSSAPIQPTSRFPSSIPTAAPSVHPTIPTYHPTDVPTPAPTKINYYIVGGATNPPTLYSGDGNVYANESPIHERAIGIMSDNWLFTAMAGGVLLCCCFIVCIRCCRRRKQKKLAPQSRRRYVDDEKIGLAVYQNPKVCVLCVYVDVYAVCICMDLYSTSLCRPNL